MHAVNDRANKQISSNKRIVKWNKHRPTKYTISMFRTAWTSKSVNNLFSLTIVYFGPVLFKESLAN